MLPPKIFVDIYFKSFIGSSFHTFIGKMKYGEAGGRRKDESWQR
jgi:hypothetical protein